MIFQDISLSDLRVNKANDRHGDQGTEKAAIAWLFENKPVEMLNLIKDIADNKQLFDPPLVKQIGSKFIVFDGNRRVASLKVIANPILAPIEFRTRISEATSSFRINENYSVACQIQNDQAVVDLTLSRRHGGTDTGRGQLKWDPRAKEIYAKRIGVKSQYPIAEATENYLKKIGYPSAHKIKRSTLFRLLNTKERQKKFGISLGGDGNLKIDRDEGKVVQLLTAIADDIVEDKLTLRDVLNKEGINAYLLEFEKTHELFKAGPNGSRTTPKTGVLKPRPAQRQSLIPRDVVFPIQWLSRQGKIRKLWEELTFSLKFSSHELSIPISFRVLVELIVSDGLRRFDKKSKNSLAKDFRSLVLVLSAQDQLNSKEAQDLERFCSNTNSARELEALHRVVHSSSYSIAPKDLIAMWDSVEPFFLSILDTKSS